MRFYVDTMCGICNENVVRIGLTGDDGGEGLHGTSIRRLRTVQAERCVRIVGLSCQCKISHLLLLVTVYLDVDAKSADTWYKAK